MSKNPVTIKLTLPKKTLELTLKEALFLRDKLVTMFGGGEREANVPLSDSCYNAKVFSDVYGVISEKELIK